MDRGDDERERDGGSRADQGRDQGRGQEREPGAPDRAPDRTPDHERPGAHRTRQERERNQRLEVREADKADIRRLSPYSTEQRLMGLLAELGERYRLDYEREYKIRDEPNDWYVTHVDVAWPTDRLVIEVYGGVHRKEFFDPTGARADDDRQRIDDVRACGWRVLIVHDTELSRKRWRAAVAKVENFLNEGRSGGST